MFHSLIHFSTLAGGLFEEGHPPGEAMTIHLGLTPFGVVVVVLLVCLFAWIALNVQANRADLHAAGHSAHHGDGHHDDGAHNAGHH